MLRCSRLLPSLAALAAALAFWAPPAGAQEPDPLDPASGITQEPEAEDDLFPRSFDKPKGLHPYFALTGNVRALYNADFDNASGNLTIARYATGLRFHDPYEGWAWSVGPSMRRYSFKFDGMTPFGSPSPWGTISARNFGAELWLLLGENWTANASISSEWAGEESARKREHSFRTSALFGYRVTEDFTVMAGVFHLNGLENDITIPLVAFEWSLLDKLGIVSDEEGARVEYKPWEAWTLDLGFAGDAYQARLGPTAAVPDGILEGVELDIGLRLKFKPRRGRQFSLGVMTNFYYDLDLLDAFGRFVASTRLEPGLIFFFDFEVFF